MLLINSVLQGIYVLNRTFGVGLSTRVPRNSTLTPYLLVNFGEPCAQKLQNCQKVGLGRVCDHNTHKRQQDVRMSLHQEEHAMTSRIPTPGKDTAEQPPQYLELCQHPRHPAPRAPPLLSGRVRMPSRGTSCRHELAISGPFLSSARRMNAHHGQASACQCALSM